MCFIRAWCYTKEGNYNDELPAKRSAKIIYARFSRRFESVLQFRTRNRNSKQRKAETHESLDRVKVCTYIYLGTRRVEQNFSRRKDQQRQNRHMCTTARRQAIRGETESKNVQSIVANKQKLGDAGRPSS